MLRRLAGQQTQRLVRKSAVRYVVILYNVESTWAFLCYFRKKKNRFCSTAVEETTDKGMYDPEVISSHEKQVCSF